MTSLSVDRGTRPRPAWRRRPLVLGIATQTVTLIPTEVQTRGPQEAMFLALAAKLRPIRHSCDSLPDAVASATTAADGMGLSQAAKTYELNTVVDNSMRCASIYETVAGTIFLTVRGPRG